MRLELAAYPVVDVNFGEKLALEKERLVINRTELAQVINSEGFFTEVHIDIAKPGEKTRIIHIMDAMQPRFKLTGGTSPYPGAIEAMHVAGTGRTHVLEGVCLMQTGMRQGIQEGIVDMSGPGAEYSLFSGLCNIILHCVPPRDADNALFDTVARRALVKAACYLGEVTRNLTPAKLHAYELNPDVDATLPGVVYICHLQAQGPLRDTFLYGESVRELVPTLLHPNELLDGAVVSGNYIIACQKNPTYLHVNNPVVKECYARHGKSLRFIGVVIANELNTLREKIRSAEFAVKLAKQAGAQGIILTQEGGGHADTDLMLCAKAAAKQGMKCVMLINELAGPGGDQPSLVDATPEAKYVISTGNNDQVLELPAMDRLLGGKTLCDIPDPAGSFMTSLGRMYTATNQLGVYDLMAREQ